MNIELKTLNDPKLGQHEENNCHGVQFVELNAVPQNVIPHSFVSHSFIQHSLEPFLKQCC